ncbi:MAG: hypothetical protein WDZ49_15470 [Litorilinea sp.]
MTFCPIPDDNFNMNMPILPAIESTTKLFLTGPFGSGKTEWAIRRVQWLLAQERVRGDDILIMTPQRTLAEPFLKALRKPNAPSGPPVRITTLAGLARHAVELYWPLVAAAGGFTQPQREPSFLNLETSQYHMARLVDEAIEAGDFDGIRVERSRIISQILDNLNKAALNGFTIEEAYARLDYTVPSGEQRTARLNALRAAQRISARFRHLCLDAGLVDYSLQIDLFNRCVLENEWSRTHLLRGHRHLIFDNAEEDTHMAHRLVAAWLPLLDSALIVSDNDAGYRLFLGADPAGAAELGAACDQHIELESTPQISSEIAQLSHTVVQLIKVPPAPRTGPETDPSPEEDAYPSASDAAENPFAGNPFDAPNSAGAQASSTSLEDSTLTSHGPALFFPQYELRFYPQMIQWVADQTARQVHDEGTPPGQIAILAPFLSDALRFSLQQALAAHDIPTTTHRPSRALEAEPATRCLLTLAALAHPHWGIHPPPEDLAQTLVTAIADMDPVRAHLLSQILSRGQSAGPALRHFTNFVPEMQARITFVAGEAYDRLITFLLDYRAETDYTPLDRFLARLFGEVLSQPQFGFHADADAARIAHQIIESARNFRWAIEILGEDAADQKLSPQTRAALTIPQAEIGSRYLQLIKSGALSALYVPGWRIDENAVYMAPAYTFLMRNRVVDVQFWLDIGSSGWWERLYQPLTHPYVLSQRWDIHKGWTDFDEYSARQRALRQLLMGLLRRTRRRVYLGLSTYNESGMEQTGPLLTLINRLLAADRETHTLTNG